MKKIITPWPDFLELFFFFDENILVSFNFLLYNSTEDSISALLLWPISVLALTDSE